MVGLNQITWDGNFGFTAAFNVGLDHRRVAPPTLQVNGPLGEPLEMRYKSYDDNRKTILYVHMDKGNNVTHMLVVKME
jgi:hypothetical protein